MWIVRLLNCIKKSISRTITRKLRDRRDIVPSFVLDCLHLLLKTKEFDVNSHHALQDAGDGEKHNHFNIVFATLTHPEIAKVLLRNGLNINAVSKFSSDCSGN